MVASDVNNDGVEPVTGPLGSEAKKCVVVFSGGQDSTTCLYWAIEKFGRDNVVALSFDYGQRHCIELASAKKIAEMAAVPHAIVALPIFSGLAANALTSENVEVDAVTPENDLPNTFVPGRNLFFLTYAAAWGYQRGINDVVTGVAQTDYSGYPDCRENTMLALQKTVSFGMDRSFVIHTPLMHLSKAETVKMAQRNGAIPALAYSHTCYNGVFPPCERCPACELRAVGFASAMVGDPLVERARGL